MAHKWQHRSQTVFLASKLQSDLRHIESWTKIYRFVDVNSIFVMLRRPERNVDFCSACWLLLLGVCECDSEHYPFGGIHMPYEDVNVDRFFIFCRFLRVNNEQFVLGGEH